jgi:hypothetical protein
MLNLNEEETVFAFREELTGCELSDLGVEAERKGFERFFRVEAALGKPALTIY